MAQGQANGSRRGLTISKVLALGAMSGILLMSAAAQASDRRGAFTEEFHKVYPLSAQGRIEIENINGPVHITGWDRNEVKVDAVKSAWSKERLDEAQIDVRAEQNNLSIRTEYPDHDRTFNFGGNFGNNSSNDDEHNNPASVEYTITVPRQAQLDKINLVNGRLDVQEVAGGGYASSVLERGSGAQLQSCVSH